MTKAGLKLAVAIVIATFSELSVASNIGASVPEPGPMGLLALGGAALFIARRFTRNK